MNFFFHPRYVSCAHVPRWPSFSHKDGMEARLAPSCRSVEDEESEIPNILTPTGPLALVSESRSPGDADVERWIPHNGYLVTKTLPNGQQHKLAQRANHIPVPLRRQQHKLAQRTDYPPWQAYIRRKHSCVRLIRPITGRPASAAVPPVH